MALTFARFPLPLRLGTDICRVARMDNILNGPTAAQFIKRILTEDEQKNAMHLLAPYLAGLVLVPQPTHTQADQWKTIRYSKAAFFIAGRYAAKEAVKKASDRDAIGWQDIVIGKEPSGRPFAVIKATQEGNGGRDREALISISHDGSYATATCIVATEEAWPKDESDVEGEKERTGDAGEAGRSDAEG